jgi:hypothetical protein
MTPGEVPSAFVQQVARIESGNRPGAVSRGSSAAGLFQFTIGTWEHLVREHPELRLTLADRMNPAGAERGFRAYTADNAAFLRARLGRQPSLSELYLAHFLGCHGAALVLEAPPKAKVSAVVPGAARSNRFLQAMTVADLRAWARSRVPDALPVPDPPAKAKRRGADADDLNALQLGRLRDDTQ